MGRTFRRDVEISTESIKQKFLEFITSNTDGWHFIYWTGDMNIHTEPISTYTPIQLIQQWETNVDSSPDILWCVKVTAAELITAQSLSVEFSSSAHRHSITTPLRCIKKTEQDLKTNTTSLHYYQYQNLMVKLT